MKLYTSYFYQIRFFTPNMIPVSTAIWDLKWYHNFCDSDNVFMDKNGGINDLRAEALHHDSALDGMCVGKYGVTLGCTHNPSTCTFVKGYMDQLNRLDCYDYAHHLENLGQKMKRVADFEGEPGNHPYRL